MVVIISKKILTVFILIFIALAMVVTFSGNFLFFVVKSNSMSPKIAKGSVVVVNKNADAENLTEGNIIAYKYSGDSGRVVTHRIVNVSEYDSFKLFKTKGDSNDYADSLPVTRSEIVGKVILSIPYASTVLNVIMHPAVIIILFYVPMGIFLGIELSRMEARFKTS